MRRKLYVFGETGTRLTGRSFCPRKPLERDDIKRIRMGIDRVSALLDEQPDALLAQLNDEPTDRTFKAASKQEREGVELLLHVIAALIEQDAEGELAE